MDLSADQLTGWSFYDGPFRVLDSRVLTTSVICGQVSCSSCPAAPSMVVTTLPGSRIIRQSSQPESSAPCCRAPCVQHSHSVAVSTSLKQLRDHNDGIAGIAADSLRINGAMSNFKQVLYSKHYTLPLMYVTKWILHLPIFFVRLSISIWLTLIKHYALYPLRQC